MSSAQQHQFTAEASCGAHRVTVHLERTPNSFQTFKKDILRALSLPENSFGDFRIEWKDSEGDFIWINSDSDFRDATLECATFGAGISAGSGQSSTCMVVRAVPEDICSNPFKDVMESNDGAAADDWVVVD